MAASNSAPATPTSDKSFRRHLDAIVLEALPPEQWAGSFGAYEVAEVRHPKGVCLTVTGELGRREWTELFGRVGGLAKRMAADAVQVRHRGGLHPRIAVDLLDARISDLSGEQMGRPLRNMAGPCTIAIVTHEPTHSKVWAATFASCMARLSEGLLDGAGFIPWTDRRDLDWFLK